MNEFVPVAKLTNDRENEIPVTLPNAMWKSKEITAGGLLGVFKRSIESHIIECVCNIVVFVIAAN